jgi:hypothetical protein
MQLSKHFERSGVGRVVSRGMRERIARPSGDTSWIRDFEESMRNIMTLNALLGRHIESLT